MKERLLIIIPLYFCILICYYVVLSLWMLLDLLDENSSLALGIFFLTKITTTKEIISRYYLTLHCLYFSLFIILIHITITLKNIQLSLLSFFILYLFVNVFNYFHYFIILKILWVWKTTFVVNTVIFEKHLYYFFFIFMFILSLS